MEITPPPAETEPPVDNEPPTETDPPTETPPAETAIPEEPYVYHEKVPILMYHEVNDEVLNNLYLSVEDFKSQLDYFVEADITPITMEQLWEHWVNKKPLPEKPIVLTFDDGYRSMYTTVYPLLKERGWCGTFYCISEARWDESFLSADMIKDMYENGMEIGSHTMTHNELTTLTADSLAKELSGSKEALSKISGSEITQLCYPSGRNNSKVREAVKAADYRCAVTTEWGFAAEAQGLLSLKRLRINSGCSGAVLKKTLSKIGY